MIVLSVLLALAANSWAEGRRQRQLETQARDSFVKEIRANRALVVQALPYHESLTRAVLVADSVGGVTSYAEWRRRAPMWSGFAPPDVAATAWQSSLTTGALSGLSYPQVAALSRAYTVQAKLDGFTMTYLPIFDFSDPAMNATVRRMHVYMQTVLSYEHALVVDYDAALAALGEPAR